MEAINKTTLFQKIKTYKKHPFSAVMYGLIMLAAAITVLSLFFIIIYILAKGIPYIKPSLFSLTYTSENVSLMPSLINTVTIVITSLIIAIPIGVFSAIYLVEYAKRGSKLVLAIRLTTETLQGIPSIVFGLFGYLFFVIFLNWRYSLIAGALTLSIMILPVIMRTTEEALLSVPDSYREASFGIGAGKLRTVFKAVLPSALPGIVSGIILSIGRIVGETAALIYTSGTMSQVPKSIMGSGSTLAIHMYNLSRENLHVNEAYATAVVLIIIVLAINWISSFVAKKIAKGE